MPAPKGHAPYNVNGEGGRTKIYTEDFLNKEADKLYEWIQDKNNIFIQDFCYERGYHESRVDEFVRDNERFALACNMLKMRQKSALFKGGLNKKYAYPMCALILSHHHNIVAKTEQKLSGSATDPVGVMFMQIEGTSKDLVEENE